METCNEKRRWGDFLPPRLFEICGLSFLSVFILRTCSCVYTRFSSSCSTNKEYRERKINGLLSYYLHVGFIRMFVGIYSITIISFLKTLVWFNIFRMHSIRFTATVYHQIGLSTCTYLHCLVWMKKNQGASLEIVRFSEFFVSCNKRK